LTGAGIAVGLTLMLAAGFGLRHLLFDISPFDPIEHRESIKSTIAGTPND
jgi:hypothetical protein